MCEKLKNLWGWKGQHYEWTIGLGLSFWCIDCASIISGQIHSNHHWRITRNTQNHRPWTHSNWTGTSGLLRVTDCWEMCVRSSGPSHGHRVPFCAVILVVGPTHVCTWAVDIARGQKKNKHILFTCNHLLLLFCCFWWQYRPRRANCTS